MTMRSHSSARKPLAVGSALSALLFASFALAADRAPIDKASGQVSEAIAVLKDVKVGSRGGDEHLEKARGYLARARAELLKAQGQDAPE
jgi:hypothetical protein